MKRLLSRRWGLATFVLLVGMLAACGGSFPSTSPINSGGTVAKTRANGTVRSNAKTGKKKTAGALPNVTAVPIGQINDGTSIAVAELPAEAQVTLQLIRKGGPYPYKQDGEIFQNREGHLPKRATGYYHEYTVLTPGSSNRSTRRIITGSQGEFYYTDDHYNSFKVIQLE